MNDVEQGGFRWIDRSLVIVVMIGVLSLVGCTRHYTGEHLVPFKAAAVISG